MRTKLWILFIVLMTMPLAGCGSYALHGRVIEGSISLITVVDKNDPRLNEQGDGLGGVVISATLDPQHLNRKHLPDTMSQWSGEFTLLVDEAGAGFLEYDVEIQARLPEHAPASHRMRLPGSSKRLLIVLAPGRDEPKSRDDILGETLEMGEPYLRDN